MAVARKPLAHNGKVHPFADRFPMLSGEEMEDLVASIKADGLKNPILLTPDGTLIDGRNRLEACKRAKVKPRFEVVEDDPIPLILAQNVSRRHLNKGQRVMARVVAEVEYGWRPGREFNKGGVRDPSTSPTSAQYIARDTGVDPSMVNFAAAVYRYAPELVDQILCGGSLSQAYREVALPRKKAAESDAEALTSLRKGHHKDIVAKVESGEWTIAQAREALAARDRQKQLEKEQAKTRQKVDLLHEEVGPEVPITYVPDLNAEMTSDDIHSEFFGGDDPLGVVDDLQLEFITRLKKLRDTLHPLVGQEPPLPSDRPNRWVRDVRALVSQIVADLYAIAETYNSGSQEAKSIRRVK